MADDSGYLRSVDVIGVVQAQNRKDDEDPNYINIHQPHLNPGPTPPNSNYSTPPSKRNQRTAPTPSRVPTTPYAQGYGNPLSPRFPTTPSSSPAASPLGTPQRSTSNASAAREAPHIQPRLRTGTPSVTSSVSTPARPVDDVISEEDTPLPTRKTSRTPMVRFDVHDKKEKGKKKSIKARNLKPGEMYYGVEDTPPWYITILLGFQHYIIMFGATVSNPLVVAEKVCLGNSDEDNIIKSQLVGTIFLMSGISTLLQATIGSRLPIIQGGSFSYVTPIVALMALPQWKCPDVSVPTTGDPLMTFPVNMTSLNATAYDEPPWKARLLEVQGALMVASLFEMLVGFTGLIGLVLKFIGPLSVAPTIALVGLGLFKEATRYASKQWWIALVTVVLIAAFSQYTKNINIPCFHFKRGQGCTKVNVPVFRLFPIILAVSITWMICAILTATNVFPDDPTKWGYAGQTNARIEVLHNAPWFRVPYPGQWGMPTVSVAAVFGMLSAITASVVESVGDYYACARLSDAPPPPMHAINRGIGVEGLTCLIAGAWGHGSGTTSYSENIGAIGITRVASRRVTIAAAVIMMIFGVFGKFGALFVTIPEPVIGGVFIVMFGMITAVGISNLQFADLNSSRNLFIIGFTFFFGISLPAYLQSNPGVISVGVSQIDQVLTVLLSTDMFVGGLAGFVLDNTIPGTDDERGLTKWRQSHGTGQSKSQKRTRGDTTTDEQRLEAQRLIDECYDLPFVTKYLRGKNWARYVPFLPTFDEQLLTCKIKKKKSKTTQETDDTDENNTDGIV